MKNKEQIEIIKQRLENGTAKAIFKTLHITDEQVEQCLNICKKTVKNYYKENKEWQN